MAFKFSPPVIAALLTGGAALFVWGVRATIGAVAARDAAIAGEARAGALTEARAAGVSGVAAELAKALEGARADRVAADAERQRLAAATVAAEASQRAAQRALNEDPAYAACGRQTLPPAARLHPYFGLRDTPAGDADPGPGGH